ncbi:hypothetical protein YC2023_115093 [Brassica napus]
MAHIEYIINELMETFKRHVAKSLGKYSLVDLYIGYACKGNELKNLFSGTMASLCTALKPLSPFSSFVKQGYSMNTSALFTYHTSNYTHSFRPKRRGALAVHNNAPDPVESSWRKPLSEDVKGRQKSAFWKRSWNSTDVRNVVIMGGFHLLSLSAPLYFS